MEGGEIFLIIIGNLFLLWLVWPEKKGVSDEEIRRVKTKKGLNRLYKKVRERGIREFINASSETVESDKPFAVSIHDTYLVRRYVEVTTSDFCTSCGGEGYVELIDNDDIGCFNCGGNIYRRGRGTEMNTFRVYQDGSIFQRKGKHLLEVRFPIGGKT